MTSMDNGTYVNNGAAVLDMRGDHLTPAERRRLAAEAQGTPFDPFERLFASYDGGTAFAYSEFEAADYRAMLERDGKASSLEQILTLPVRGAEWSIEADEGDSGEAEFVKDVLADKLNLIIDQMTSAVTYRRAYFETTWTVNEDGRAVYKDVAMRPATGCEPGFEPRTGRPKGFRQQIVPVAGIWPRGQEQDKTSDPGWVIVKPMRAFVYVHGIHRDPVNGLSDLRAAHWCYQTKQKVLFLWFQFLEQQSLPKTIVYGDDDTQAAERAQKFRDLKSSGVMGLERPSEPNAKAFEIVESSGHGAQQFERAVTYLDSMMSMSVLAGFTDLTSQLGGSVGSFALSSDQSEFFLNSRQAVADEMADAIRRDLFGPLVAFNFGIDAPVPKIEIGPISKKHGKNALDMLTAIITAVNLNVPRDFVDQLTVLCASALGMDPADVQKAIDEDAENRKETAELQAEVNRAQAAQAVQEAADAEQNATMGAPDATGGPPVATGPPAGQDAALSNEVPAEALDLVQTVDAVYELVRRVRGRADGSGGSAPVLP